MGIIRCFDQLHIDPHLVADFAHTAFEDVGDAELPRDLGQVIGDTLVMLGGSVRDHLQVRDLGEAGEDLVLDAFGKVSIRFFFAQILKRENGD